MDTPTPGLIPLAMDHGPWNREANWTFGVLGALGDAGRDPSPPLIGA